MSRRVLASALVACATLVPAFAATPAQAEPCELGCIVKCIQSTVVSFCPPV